MRTPVRVLPAALVLVGLTTGMAGCVTYKNTPQPDSAIVRGKTVPVPFLPTGFSVIIQSIDGRNVQLGRQFLLLFGLATDGEIHVSPGKHTVALFCKRSLPPLDVQTAFVGAEFAANHRYRFGLAGDFDITLWDETAGVEKRTNAGEWHISRAVYSDEDNEPIETVDFDGAQPTRPPLHSGRPDGRGDHIHPPSGSGGPPSIPHNPRPNPGGGGDGHSGGGNGGGGDKGGGGHDGGGGGSGSSHGGSGSGGGDGGGGHKK